MKTKKLLSAVFTILLSLGLFSASAYAVQWSGDNTYDRESVYVYEYDVPLVIDENERWILCDPTSSGWHGIYNKVDLYINSYYEFVSYDDPERNRYYMVFGNFSHMSGWIIAPAGDGAFYIKPSEGLYLKRQGGLGNAVNSVITTTSKSDATRWKLNDEGKIYDVQEWGGTKLYLYYNGDDSCLDVSHDGLTGARINAFKFCRREPNTNYKLRLTVEEVEDSGATSTEILEFKDYNVTETVIPCYEKPVEGTPLNIFTFDGTTTKNLKMHNELDEEGGGTIKWTFDFSSSIPPRTIGDDFKAKVKHYPSSETSRVVWDKDGNALVMGYCKEGHFTGYSNPEVTKTQEIPATCTSKGSITYAINLPVEMEMYTNSLAARTYRDAITDTETIEVNLDSNNHSSDEFTYISNGDGTHKRVHACCGKTAANAEACTYVSGSVCNRCAPEAITHCSCGGNTNIGDHTEHTNIMFAAWSDATSLPTEAGNYRLITDVTINNSKEGWHPADGTVLCLNGHNITNAGGKRVIQVEDGATFTLCECQETQGKLFVTSTGEKVDGAIEVAEGCTFNMYGGILTGADSSTWKGGGIDNNGTTKMYGGTIAGNKMQFGGGVYNKGTFYMYGGEIRDNTATDDIIGNGGGVYNKGTFYMYGGNISGNTANVEGGGIYTDKNIAIEQSPAVTGNTGGNLYLTKDAKVVVGNLNSDANIGITLEDDYDSYMIFSSGGADYKNHFTSDNTNYVVFPIGSDLGLVYEDVLVMSGNTQKQICVALPKVSSESADIIAGFYDADGRLVNTQIKSYTGETLEFDTDLAFDTVKVMAWESILGMKPLFEPVNAYGTRLNPYIVTTEAELRDAIFSTDNEINYIKLGNDISFDTQITIVSENKPVVIDLNGKTLYSTSTKDFGIRNYGVLTLKDSVGTGVFKANMTVIFSTGTFTFESGSAINVGDLDKCCVENGGGGTMVMESGTISASRDCALYNNGNLTINGGTITNSGETWALRNSNDTCIITGKSETVISGADEAITLDNSCKSVTVEEGAKLTVTGAIKVSKGTLTLKGGTYSVDPSDITGVAIPDGFGVKGSGPYTVEAK